MDHSPAPSVPEFLPPQPSKFNSHGDKGKNCTSPLKSAPQEVSPPILRSPLPGLASRVASGTPDLSSKARSPSQLTAKTGDKEKCALRKLASTPPPQNFGENPKTKGSSTTKLPPPLDNTIIHSFAPSGAEFPPPRPLKLNSTGDKGKNVGYQVEIQEFVGLGARNKPANSINQYNNQPAWEF